EELAEANEFLLGLGLVKWPTSKVFEQDPRSGQNGFECSYRFQDELGFVVLRMKAEDLRFSADLDPDFFEEPLSSRRCSAVLDFDRGSFGDIDAKAFNPGEWLRGYFHILRRDLPKVVEG